jgi:hypothetical protein
MAANRKYCCRPCMPAHGRVRHLAGVDAMTAIEAVVRRLRAHDREGSRVVFARGRPDADVG